MLLLCLAIVLIAFRGVLGRLLARDSEQEQASAVLSPLAIHTPQDAYWRYDLIPVTVRVVDPQGNPRSDQPPRIIVTHDGKRVTTIGHEGDRVTVRYDGKKQAWVGNWPPGWNPEPGRYQFEARVEIDPTEWPWKVSAGEEDEDEERPEGEAWAVALAPFEIRARERPPMEPGLCVATWEFDFRSRFRGPDDTAGDWTKLFEWVEYIGADTLWFRGAVTQPPDQGLTLEQPFKPLNLEAIPRLGREAHRRGLKFGTWAVAYATYPRTDESKNPDYDYSIDISRSTGQTTETDYISLYDDRRGQHLADFFRVMQASEHVDMVGLDYMRTDPGSGGYELVDRFAAEMPVELPEGWESWGERRRQKYVAVKVEKEYQSDRDFYDCWNWWRAHLAANIIRRIIQKSGVQKPTWVFMLSWWHGMQHGQDPPMFTDAGITMLAPMLYEVDDRPQFDAMVEGWSEYLRPGQVNLVVGDQVDFLRHQRMKYGPTPAELYDRMVTAHRKYLEGGFTQGAFWHDINRAVNPNSVGPFDGREWALAGAAAFSTVRDTWKVYPLHAELSAPDSAPIANAFGVEVTVENLTKQPVEGVRISLCDTPHMVGVGLQEAPEAQLWGEPYTDVGTIPAGQAVEVPIRVRITTADAQRRNQTMLALRITWDEGDFQPPVRNELPRTIVLMKYIRGI